MSSTMCLFAQITLSIASPSPQSLGETLLQSLEEGIEQERKAQSIIGLSVAIGLDGELAWTRGFGLADLENGVPASEHTVYRLGSISKPITAVAVMQLAKRGSVDLDAPIETYVPKWPKKRWEVTTRQLLCHQGGVRHYLPTDNLNNTKAYATATEGLEYFADDPLIAEPGTQYAYSSFGYNLLGAIVEGASGKPFVDYLNEAVFSPAGTIAMQDDSQARVIKHRAQGYRRIDGEVCNSMLVDISYKLGGGGLCGTAADLVRFAHAMMAGDLVDSETREQMWTRQLTQDGTETEYGFGWMIHQDDDGKIVRHGGAQSRVRTSLLCLVDEGIVVAAMCNSEWARPPRIVLPIAQQLSLARR